jgi:hypothetical protein
LEDISSEAIKKIRTDFGIKREMIESIVLQPQCRPDVDVRVIRTLVNTLFDQLEILRNHRSGEKFLKNDDDL